MNLLPEQKSRTRLFLISLISLTALVLVLVVTLLVVTLAKSKTPVVPEPDAIQTFLPVDETPKESDPAEQTVDEVQPSTPEPISLGNGLAFTRNGDGTCRLSGIGSCTDAFVIIPETSPDGDLVTEIASDAFYGKSGITAVQIPSTVQYIGERAFADCRDLLYISVSDQNRFYSAIEGVLYSKDRRVLLQYPTLCAAGSIKIPIEVAEIREMAFYNCPYLAKIYYPGSPAEWDSIKIGSKNYALSSAAKQFYSERTGKSFILKTRRACRESCR